MMLPKAFLSIVAAWLSAWEENFLGAGIFFTKLVIWVWFHKVSGELETTKLGMVCDGSRSGVQRKNESIRNAPRPEKAAVVAMVTLPKPLLTKTHAHTIRLCPKQAISNKCMRTTWLDA